MTEEGSDRGRVRKTEEGSDRGRDRQTKEGSDRAMVSQRKCQTEEWSGRGRVK